MSAAARVQGVLIRGKKVFRLFLVTNPDKPELKNKFILSADASEGSYRYSEGSQREEPRINLKTAVDRAKPQSTQRKAKT